MADLWRGLGPFRWSPTVGLVGIVTFVAEVLGKRCPEGPALGGYAGAAIC